MATKQDFDALQTEFDTETTVVANYIDTLKAKIAAGGMTADEEKAVLDGLTAASARLKALGTQTPAPPLP